jgi:predicted transcriptional regulator
MERRTALFSLKPTFASAILSGEKRFEFRRVRPSLDRGDTIIVYSTAPEMAIVGSFLCGRILEGSPSSLWKSLGSKAGTRRASFDDYFADSEIGYAIEVRKPLAWSNPLSLSAIRERFPKYHPPQSYSYLLPEHSLTRLISQRMPAGA